jgi:hypothetical protein
VEVVSVTTEEMVIQTTDGAKWRMLAANTEEQAMDRLSLLKEISFGAQVAEEETADLANYFVETDQWLRIFKGDIDVVRGDKGSGKSAIYSLLSAKDDELLAKNILLISAEKPRGTPVFKELITDPPASEKEFEGLWKLYIVSLIAQRMKDFDIKGTAATKLYEYLTDEGLLNLNNDLARLLRIVKEYAKRWLAPSIETELKFDPHTGMPTGIAGKITPSEPSADLRSHGYTSVDHLLKLANDALGTVNYQIWVLLDRLDVAFAETHDLERNALRALFRVYLDLSGFKQIKLKIFLRSDIWNRIVEGGFREASHITRVAVLEWTSPALLNLVIKRLLKNQSLVDEFKLDRQAVLGNFSAQNDLFYGFFPTQVEQGRNKPKTFDWMVSRCADATAKTEPRELIHLLIMIRDQEIARLERGEALPSGDQLFDRSVFKVALPAVSEARLVQNLYAEYPDLKPLLAKLNGQKTEQTAESLAAIWSLNGDQTVKVADQLCDIGFFERRQVGNRDTYWVPFLFRDALHMSQGREPMIRRKLGRREG